MARKGSFQVFLYEREAGAACDVKKGLVIFQMSTNLKKISDFNVSQTFSNLWFIPIFPENFKYKVILVKTFYKPNLMVFSQMSTNLEKSKFQTSIFPRHFPDGGLVQFSPKNFKYKVILGETLEKHSLMDFFQMSTNLEKLRFHTSIFPKCFPN